MNIQIYGRAKCFDTKKAERFFKERRVPFQRIDLSEKPLSKGEYQKIKAAVGGWRQMVDVHAKQYESYHFPYLALEEQIDQEIMRHQEVLKTPLVRNGNQATVGFCPEVWKQWQ